MSRFRIFAAAAVLITMVTGCSHMSATEQLILCRAELS